MPVTGLGVNPALLVLLMWPAHFGRKLVLDTTRKWPRPRWDRDEIETSASRYRDETETLTIFLETRTRRDVGTSRDRLETETSRPRPQPCHTPLIINVAAPWLDRRRHPTFSVSCRRWVPDYGRTHLRWSADASIPTTDYHRWVIQWTLLLQYDWRSLLSRVAQSCYSVI